VPSGRVSGRVTGLRRAEKERFDMVLSDVSMPGLSGWNVASDCRALFLRCPVGLVTGWGDQLIRSLSRAAVSRSPSPNHSRPRRSSARFTTALRAPVGTS